jgi:acid phosphatase (class A)
MIDELIAEDDVVKVIRRLLVLTAAALLLCGCQDLRQKPARAQQTAPPAQTQPTGAAAPVYISSNALDVAALLPGPPSPESEQDRGDLQCVLDVQASRTDQQVARAHGEEDLTVFAFADVLGPGFDAQRCPKTAKLFEQVKVDSRVFSGRAKSLWNRVRPYRADSRVHHIATHPEQDFSHPSGHSTRGVLMAELLAQVFPDRRQALLDRGRQIGWDRVILGMHYPTDVYAGQTLGHALTPKFLASEKFTKDFDEAAKEMRAAVAGMAQAIATYEEARHPEAYSPKDLGSRRALARPRSFAEYRSG